jgi:hypothetical protein
MWPITATAASITFGEKLTSIPALSILMTLLLSTLSGVTSLLNAMKREYEQNKTIDRLWLFISSKLLGSNLAGLLAFLGSEYWGVPDTAIAIAIILAAFGGGPLIERGLNKYADKYLPGST